jgi:NAD+ kinase
MNVPFRIVKEDLCPEPLPRIPHRCGPAGPILAPSAESFILAPICPHAPAYRPLVMDAGRRIAVRVIRANQGTTVSIDGHAIFPFQVGHRLEMCRYAADFLTVRNPKHPPWSALRRKLMWGEGPNMQ